MKSTVPGSLHLQKSRREFLLDCAYLCLIVALSSVLYIRKLGFYSDDWAVLGIFTNSRNQSLWALFQSFYTPEVAKRPVQIFYYALLYKLFGLNPTGHHIFNHVVFCCGLILFYAVLREFRFERVTALAIPAVYALLPHYSTARFWFMSFQVFMAMSLYFLSLFLDLKALRSRGPQLVLLKTISVLAIFCCILAYELFLPLFLVNILLAALLGRRLYRMESRSLLFLASVNLMAIAGAVSVKVLLLETTKVLMQGVQSHLLWFVNIVADFARLSYITYGIKLPVIVKQSIGYSSWEIVCMSLLLGLFVFLYSYRASMGAFKEPLLSLRRQMLTFVLAGFAFFLLAYSIFLLSENAAVTATGINNRFTAAATIGVAISLVGVIGNFAILFRSQNIRRFVFVFFVSALCSAGCLVNNSIAGFWGTAYKNEKTILSDIQRHFPTIQAGSTIILDGVCPYIGPGIVFESSWDLAGALEIVYHNQSFEADIATRTTRITKEGLQTTLYGEQFTYPFHKLFIYDYRRKVISAVPSYDAARSYFQNNDHPFGKECPQGYEGFGVPIFESVK